MNDEVGDLYYYAKLRGFCSLPQTGAYKVTRLVFWFLRQPTAKNAAPTFTINTPNDVVSRKNLPFGGPENKILHFDSIFHKKTQILANF